MGPARTALPFSFPVDVQGVHNGVSVGQARRGARPDRQASRQGGGGGDQQAKGRKKAGTLALSWGLAWGGRNSQSCPGLGVGEPPPAPCLRSASPRGQWVRAAAARAVCGWSAGPGGPQAAPSQFPGDGTRRDGPYFPQPSTAPALPRPLGRNSATAPSPTHTHSPVSGEAGKGVGILGSHAYLITQH